MKNNFLDNYKLEGEKLPIFTYPDPILKKIASPVSEFNDDLHKLIKNMLFTMYHAPGIGLAAPQVGSSIRMFVLDIWFEREKVTLADGTEEYRLSEFSPMVFINPVFKNKSGEVVHEEGCLSVPGIFEDVKRAELVTIEYQNMFGEKHELDADELLSVCLQHENDHLDGIVFIERLSFLKKQLLEKKFLKQQKKK
ncbi:MAG: peptide deformylase [Bacteriovorax sp.]|jgi:peptide deformylase